MKHNVHKLWKVRSFGWLPGFRSMIVWGDWLAREPDLTIRPQSRATASANQEEAVELLWTPFNDAWMNVSHDKIPGKTQDRLERLYLPVGLRRSGDPHGRASICGWASSACFHHGLTRKMNKWIKYIGPKTCHQTLSLKNSSEHLTHVSSICLKSEKEWDRISSRKSLIVVVLDNAK